MVIGDNISSGPNFKLRHYRQSNNRNYEFSNRRTSGLGNRFEVYPAKIYRLAVGKIANVGIQPISACSFHTSGSTLLTESGQYGMQNMWYFYNTIWGRGVLKPYSEGGFLTANWSGIGR